MASEMLDPAREALRRHVQELDAAFVKLQRRPSRQTRLAMKVLCEEMRPHIIAISSDISEARQNLEFFDRLSTEPGRNSRTMTALVIKLIGREPERESSEQANLQENRFRLLGTQAQPQEAQPRQRTGANSIIVQCMVSAEVFGRRTMGPRAPLKAMAQPCWLHEATQQDFRPIFSSIPSIPSFGKLAYAAKILLPSSATRRSRHPEK
jgi:hypothetical protein